MENEKEIVNRYLYVCMYVCILFHIYCIYSAQVDQFEFSLEETTPQMPIFSRIYVRHAKLQKSLL